MILDEKGGPWLVSPVHGNPPDNIQHAVVIIDRLTKKVTYTGLYYYLTHFSKYVRPGAVRVESKSSTQGIRCIAFKSQQGEMILQMINSRKNGTSVSVAWRGRQLSLQLDPISITTCRWKIQG
jgi:glucosylceramidase